MSARPVIFLFLILQGTFVYGQDDTLKSILHKFNTHTQQAYQEKIYLHSDHSFYLTGDYFWFKVYAVDGVLHRPSSLSKIVYVEILDDQKKPVLQSKVSLVDGSGNGSLFLPASLNSGNYYVRAYSRWMQNFDPAFFFHRVITIVNPFKPLQLTEPSGTSQYDVQFFPEGGDLVAGVESKIAFRCVDKSGKGVSFTGLIINQKSDTLTSFSPLKFGLGHFQLKAIQGEVYRAVISDTSGNILATKELPVANEYGYSVNLREEGNRISVSVVARQRETDARVVHLLVHSRGVVKAAVTRTLQDGSASFTIDRSDLPEGISHITVFNHSKKPVCERLYFNSSSNRLELKLSAEASQYTVREKVTVSVVADDSNGEGAASKLSAAVYRLDELQGEDPVNIRNHLLLTSELRGAVESPEYYFGEDENVKEAVDILMLTHGWRRFTWQQVLSSPERPSFQYFPEYRGHIVYGTITHEGTGELTSNIPVYLSVPGKYFHLRGTKSNMKGEIRFELKDFYGPNRIIVQTNTREDSVYRIHLRNPFSDRFIDETIPVFDLQEKCSEQLVKRSMGMQFENAYFEQQRSRIAYPVVDSSYFYRTPDQSFKLDDYTRFPVMEEVMREYVPGVMVRKRRKDFYFYALNKNENQYFRESPMVILDGVPVFDINKIIGYDPLRIKQLDVMTRKYFYGPLSFQGLVSYTTYNGDLRDFPLDKRALLLDYEGVQYQREFFSPVYDTPQQRASRVPDYRNVLFWSPAITTNEQGEGSFHFYTSDQPGKYLVNIQGISDDGLCGNHSIIIEVEGTDEH